MVPVSECAARLKCSRRTISRLLKSGELKGRRQGRQTLVDVAEARAVLSRRGSLAPPPIEKPPEIPPEVAEAIERDPTGVLLELATDPAKVAAMSPAVARVVVNACEAVRRERDASQKRGTETSMTPKQYVDGLRAAGERFIRHVESSEESMARRVVNHLRDDLSCVPKDLTLCAISVVRHHFARSLNAALDEYRRAIEERCAAAKPTHTSGK